MSILSCRCASASNPAPFLGREESQGSVQTGKRADLVALDADPLLDIRNVSQIADVVVRGRLLTRPEIDRIIARHKRPDATR